MSHRFTVLIILLITFAALVPRLQAGEDTNEQQIEALLLRYARSLDTQDAQTAEHDLYAEARQFAVTPNGVLAIGQSDYLGLLAQKKIGGVPSNPSVRQTHVAGAAASAILERPIEGRPVLFTHYVQLLYIDSAWKVVSVTTGITETKP